MYANPIFQAFLPNPFHGKISLGGRKSDRVDLSTGDCSSDGNRQGSPTGADFQDSMTRFNLCLGDDVSDFAHLSGVKVIKDVLGGR